MKTETENLAMLEARHVESAYLDSLDSKARRNRIKADRKALQSERREARRNKAARRAFCGGVV